MEEMSYLFLFTFFSLPLIFTLIRWPLAFFIFSPPLQTCHTGLPTKKCLLYCLFLALDLCRPFSRLASPACRLLSLFICLSLALYSKFVDMTISLSLILILQKTRIQEQFPLSVFVFIDSLVVSALQDAAGYGISRQNNLELHLGRHPCWLSYFTLVCLWCGRKVGRCTVTWLPNVPKWVHLLGYGAPPTRGAPLLYGWIRERARWAGFPAMVPRSRWLYIGLVLFLRFYWPRLLLGQKKAKKNLSNILGK